MFALSGILLNSERKQGTFVPDGETEPRSWDYTELTVLPQDGTDTVKVRLPKDVHQHPWSRGGAVDLSVVLPPRTKMTVTPESLAASRSKAA